MRYDEKDIQVLEGPEVIRVNPGGFISTLETPTHLLEECLDNALDEAYAGFCDSIKVFINTKDKIYKVIDTGRGIPISTIPLVCTSLFSGSKFKDRKSAYEICTGLHGIGLVAVNALSKRMVVEVSRDNKQTTCVFEKGKQISSKEEAEKNNSHYTEISFIPDDKFFSSLDIDLQRLKTRLEIASISLPKTKIELIIDNVCEKIETKSDEFFEKNCLSKDDDSKSKTIKIEVRDKVERLSVEFCYSYEGAISPKIISSVNLLPVPLGGTHILMFYDILRQIFYSFGKRKGKTFSLQDSLVGVRAFISLDIKEPELGTTKEKLTNKKEYLSKLFKKFETELVQFLNQNEDLLDDLLEFFFQYRRKQTIKKVVRKSSKRSSARLTKLKDCIEDGGELFICEGDSAEGTINQARDIRIHAVIPVKGKTINVITAKDAMQNNEIQEIIHSLGTGIEGHDFDISKLRYSKIIVLTDSDPDGGHIASLLIMVFAILTPQIIKQGKLFICKTPLYAIVKEKKFVPLWTKEDLNNARKTESHITRFKGLGEFDPWQLEVFAMSKKRRLIPVTYTKNILKMSKLFRDSDEKRKLLEGKFTI
jgi:DNA gyrase subunit B